MYRLWAKDFYILIVDKRPTAERTNTLIQYKSRSCIELLCYWNLQLLARAHKFNEKNVL